MNNLSFFQTSAPDFDDDVTVKIPAPNVLPVIPPKNQVQNLNDSSIKPKVEDSTIVGKNAENPKIPNKPINNDNKTSFIKPKGIENQDGKNYDVMYEYGKEMTYEMVENKRPQYEVMENQIPWSAYVTSVKKGYRDMFKEQRTKSKIGKRSSSSAGKLENTEKPLAVYVRKPDLTEEIYLTEKPLNKTPFVRQSILKEESNLEKPESEPDVSRVPQLQYFRDPLNQNKKIFPDQAEKPIFNTQPLENSNQPSNLIKPTIIAENPIYGTQPVREESTVTVKSTGSRISNSFLRFFGKESSSINTKDNSKSDSTKTDNITQPIKDIPDSGKKNTPNSGVSKNAIQTKELSNAKLNDSIIEIPTDNNLATKPNEPTISTSAKTNEPINSAPQKSNQKVNPSPVQTNTSAKPAPLTPGFQRILTNNFVPLNPVQSIDRELLVSPKKYFKNKEAEERKAKKELMLDEPKRAKDIFGNKSKSNKDDIKKVSNKALPKHMQTKNLLDATGRCYHIYYDEDPDVKGLVCCTCCQFTWYRWYKCCSNIISCPVYCYIFFIIPLIILMIVAIILLYLLRPK